MYALERLKLGTNGWLAKLDAAAGGTIFQTPAWLAFLSESQHGEPVVAALKDGQETIGYFTGLIVQRFGCRILGSPFPGWSTDYMGFALRKEVDRSRAIRALISFAFKQLRCVHVEMMDRCVNVGHLNGLATQIRLYRGFEVDLSQEEGELFSGMTSACRRCVRKAEKEGVRVEEAHDRGFADDYYAQLEDVFARQHLQPTYGIERVRQLIKHVHHTGHLLLLRARNRQGRCIATAIFPHSNGVLHFWGGASWRNYQLLRPNEAIHWEAMKIGKRMGLGIYDMGGGGEYKRKYGGREIEVPWFRKSKYHWLSYMRELAERSHRLRRGWLGRFTAKSASVEIKTRSSVR
jgi:CelD/BcsL family acetyltransferase involved in cellulose biosynthesis